jgi:hypothetical protein
MSGRTERDGENGEGNAVVEAREMAAMDFDPVDNAAMIHDFSEPTYSKMMGDMGIDLRLSAVTLGQTKAELVAIARDFLGNSEGGESLFELRDRLGDTRKRLESFVKLVAAATARLISAAAVVGVESEAAEIAVLCPPTAAEDPALKEEAAALMAECAAPLPEGDAGLSEAERRIGALLALEKLQLAEHPEDDAPWQASFDRACELDETIATSEPQTLAGAAVKLRRLLDPELGLEAGDRESDVPSLRQVLALIEREIAAKGGADV